MVWALALHQCGRVRLPNLTSYLGRVYSVLRTERFFSGYSGFPLFSKTNIWLDLRSLLISVSPISAQALERLYTYTSFLFPFLSCINDIDEIRMTLNFTCWKNWNNYKAADNIDRYTWFGLTLTRCFPNLPWKTATTEMEIFCLREMFNTWNLFAFFDHKVSVQWRIVNRYCGARRSRK